MFNNLFILKFPHMKYIIKRVIAQIQPWWLGSLERQVIIPVVRGWDLTTLNEIKQAMYTQEGFAFFPLLEACILNSRCFLICEIGFNSFWLTLLDKTNPTHRNIYFSLFLSLCFLMPCLMDFCYSLLIFLYIFSSWVSFCLHF